MVPIRKSEPFQEARTPQNLPGTREVNRLRIEASSTQAAQKAELGRIERSIAKLLNALKAGSAPKAIVEDMNRMEVRQSELEGLLADADQPPPLLHPNMARLYHEKLRGLHEALQDETARQEAITVLRSIIDSIDLVPEDGALRARITGDLAGLLTFMNANTPAGNEPDGGVWLELVAGVGFEPKTFRTR